jgi:hypothetical protein
MELEFSELIGIARRAARACDADVLLTGILPTIRQSDLTLDNLTPVPRYCELNRAMSQLRGGAFNIHIKGLDELQATHDNLMFEACCSSFQVHLQVPRSLRALQPGSRRSPLLAVAANSPLLLGQRLWHETVSLFQHRLTTFGRSDKSEAIRPREFRRRLITRSVIEIFREEIARFRVILTKEIDEDPFESIARGEPPQTLSAAFGNGTVCAGNLAMGQ